MKIKIFQKYLPDKDISILRVPCSFILSSKFSKLSKPSDQ